MNELSFDNIFLLMNDLQRAFSFDKMFYLLVMDIRVEHHEVHSDLCCPNDKKF